MIKCVYLVVGGWVVFGSMYFNTAHDELYSTYNIKQKMFILSIAGPLIWLCFIIKNTTDCIEYIMDKLGD